MMISFVDSLRNLTVKVAAGRKKGDPQAAFLETTGGAY